MSERVQSPYVEDDDIVMRESDGRPRIPQIYERRQSSDFVPTRPARVGSFPVRPQENIRFLDDRLPTDEPGLVSPRESQPDRRYERPRSRVREDVYNDDFVPEPIRRRGSSRVAVNYDRRGPPNQRSRHHAESRRRGPESDYYGSDEDQELSDDAYSFTFSGEEKSLAKIEASSFSDMSDESTLPSLQAKPPIDVLRHSTLQHVFQSRYTGDGVIGGLHGADFVVLENNGQLSKAAAMPIFRWIHFEDQHMNFDSFKAGVDAIPGLTAAERSGIALLLKKVEKRADKRIQSSPNVKARYMVPCRMDGLLEGEPMHGTAVPRIVTFTCMPYFSLEAYCEDLSGKQPQQASHPPRTLLQSIMLSTVNRARDLQQAVCSLPGVPKGHCLYITQLWSIVVDDYLLVTCSRNTVKHFFRDGMPMSRSLTTSPIPTLLVTQIGGPLFWSLELNRCRSWFDFLSHFWEFWPKKLQFECNGKTILAEEWPRIFSHAQKRGARIQMKIVPRPKMVAGLLSSPSRAGVKGDEKDLLSPNKLVEAKPFHFHIIPWSASAIEIAQTNSNLAPVDEGSDPSAITLFLREADNFLRKRTSLRHSLAYKKCSSASHAEIEQLLLKQGDEVSAIENTDTRGREIYENRVQIFNHATLIFQLFLPLTCEGPTCGRFWGAIRQLLASVSDDGVFDRTDAVVDDRAQRYSPDPPVIEKHSLVTILEWCRALSTIAQGFLDILGSATADEVSGIKCPEHLSKAWLHLVMALSLSSNGDLKGFTKHGDVCLQLLIDGKDSIGEILEPRRSSNRQPLLPVDVMRLIHLRLLGDDNSGDVDVLPVYLRYIERLNQSMALDPLNRGHQEKLYYVQEEISAVVKILRQQTELLMAPSSYFANNKSPQTTRRRARLPHASNEADFSRSRQQRQDPLLSYLEQRGPQALQAARHDVGVVNNNRPYQPYGANANFTWPGIQGEQGDLDEPYGILFQDSVAFLENRIREFEELVERAKTMESWNLRQIDTNKDRQESAIYAFTIVTIIFLPLSTVAGILGMNVSDVRDMEQEQWLFWAVAVPLTILVMTLCLVWAGELQNFWSGFQNLWSKKPKPRAAAFKAAERYDYDPPVIRERRRSPMGFAERPIIEERIVRVTTAAPNPSFFNNESRRRNDRRSGRSRSRGGSESNDSDQDRRYRR